MKKKSKNMVYVMCISFMFSQILSQNTVVAIAKGEKKVAISQIQEGVSQSLCKPSN